MQYLTCPCNHRVTAIVNMNTATKIVTNRNSLVIPSNLQYKLHQTPNLKYSSSRLAVAFVQSIEARCWVETEDVVGAAPTGDAPTTSEWSTILLTTKVRLILEILRYISYFIKIRAQCKDIFSSILSKCFHIMMSSSTRQIWGIWQR